jgi:hypothetical protein
VKLADILARRYPVGFAPGGLAGILPAPKGAYFGRDTNGGTNGGRVQTAR